MLTGFPASPGIAKGKAIVRLRGLEQLTAAKIADDEVEAEVKRFHDALRDSREQLEELKRELLAKGDVPERDVKILDVHIVCLGDPVFVQDVEKAVRGEKLNLEGSLSRVITNFARIVELVENAYIKERLSDIREVAVRILKNVRRNGTAPGAADELPPDGYILVTEELHVADVLGSERALLRGVVTEKGGRTSHAAIMARSLGIPMVINVSEVTKKIKDGTFVLFDGSVGTVYLDPSIEVRSEYEKLEKEFHQHQQEYQEVLGKESKTQDGTPVYLYASAGKPSDVEASIPYNIAGIGLYRTEYDFLLGKSLPTEEALFDSYRATSKLAGERPIIVRLLDLDSSRSFGGRHLVREPNPALGLRSLRLLLQDNELLELQLRAILRANAAGNLWILFPFVTTPDDVRSAREKVSEVAAALKAKKTPHALPRRVGALVEVPGLLPVLDVVLREVDFVTIGLDNLTQYLMAADRNNGLLWNYLEMSQPAIFRTIRSILEHAAAAGKDVFAFGEMVRDPLFTPFLIGAGLRHFSLSPVSIPRIKQVLLKCRVSASEAFAAEVLAQESKEAIKALLARKFEDVLARS
ncbi:MAG: phosphoenolpyruvate--protein phosphotransferase [Planctomycetes bacterium]|nr:phosphoenolpyruvate--protein phosphotransferase [Planctomycetota bacterium]MBI3847565.1 phosphoenolpyruvate--protein phosphotransferase [Planctomycetota bacterium]